jgi:hypothetical protein
MRHSATATYAQRCSRSNVSTLGPIRTGGFGHILAALAFVDQLPGVGDLLTR